MSAAGGFTFKTFEDGIYFFQILNTQINPENWSDTFKQFSARSMTVR